MALNVGDTVAGRYVLVERLGAGGMGIVYRAQDTTLDRDVALKVLLPHVSTDEALLQRFRREARVLAKLRNPGIIVVHDLVIAEDGSIALILEYVGGGSLDDRIAGGPLPWRTAAQIGVAAAEALAEAHDAGIVHRDIKPSNILLEPDGGVRVADFGIAQVSGEVSMTMQGEAIGTPAYMSPEQAAGSDVGPASDIYSLGAVLFAASTGVIPFPTEEGGFAAALAHITQPVPDPRTTAPGVPDAAAAIIMRAMQKEPGARFGSARELAAALRASADLTTGDIPVAMPASVPSDGPPTVDPAVAQPPPAMPPPPAAADATQLGSTPPTPPPPAVPPAPPQYAAPPMPPAPAVYAPPAAAMPAGGRPPERSMNTLFLIGAAVVLAVVAVIVGVTLIMTGGSDEAPAAAASTSATAPAAPSSEAPTDPTTAPATPSASSTGGSGSYRSDFSAQDFGTYDGPIGEALYENGEYIIAVREPDAVIWSPAPAADAVALASVRAEGRFGEFVDPRRGEMGVSCFGESVSNHYRMGVRTDGSIFIAKVLDDAVDVLVEQANAVNAYPAEGLVISGGCNTMGSVAAGLSVSVGDVTLNFTDESEPFLTGQSAVFAATTTDTDVIAIFTKFSALFGT